MNIRVKFLSRIDPREWTRFFPAEDGVWHNCQFIFDSECGNYDWLVVYDDLPARIGSGRNAAIELLRCPSQNTLLITTEPASIKAYGRVFAAQFGHVLTSQPAWALPHPQRYYQHSANHWFYGCAPDKCLSYAQMQHMPAATEKSELISAVYSSKKQWHTLHAQRFSFLAYMQQHMPELKLFGRGAIAMGDKAESLQTFRYHLAVENHIAPHHITEKLTDAFLGGCLPFYAGAPNADQYFPRESYIAVDIRNPAAALQIMRIAIANGLWEKRQAAIAEARRRVLTQEHLFAVIARIINSPRDTCNYEPLLNDNALYGRHAWRQRHPLGAIVHAAEKLYVRTRSLKRIPSVADSPSVLS